MGNVRCWGRRWFRRGQASRSCPIRRVVRNQLRSYKSGIMEGRLSLKGRLGAWPCRRNAVIVPRMIVPLTLAVFVIGTTGVLGQTPFPAPLPNGGTGTANNSPFPPVNGAPAQKTAAPQDSPFPPVNGAPAQRAAAPQASPFPPVNGSSATMSSPSAFPSGGATPLGGFGAPLQQSGRPGGAD